MPVGGAKAPRLPAERAAAAVMDGTAVIRDNTVSMPSPTRSVATLSAGIFAEAHGEAVNSAKRFARMGNLSFCGSAGIEPGALNAGKDAVVAGNGSDQRGQTAHAVAVAVEQFGMKAQRREGAMREPAGVEICFGVGAADGAAAPPKAAGRFRGVVGTRLARGRRSR